MTHPPLQTLDLPNGKTFVFVETRRLEECVRALRTGNYYGARFSRDHGYEADDLDLLEQLPALRGVHVQDPIRDVSGLRHVRSIKRLTLGAIGLDLDLSAFDTLEELRIGAWSPHYGNIGECRSLKTLYIHSYGPRRNDLSELSTLKQLESLELIGGTVNLLHGAESLPRLRTLILRYLPRLEDLTPVAGCGALRHLELDHCKKVRNFEPLTTIATLEILGVNGCGPLPNVEFVTRLRHLRRCGFVETDIVDGNLTHFLEAPNLEYVGLLGRRHYSHNTEELAIALLEKKKHQQL